MYPTELTIFSVQKHTIKPIKLKSVTKNFIAYPLTLPNNLHLYFFFYRSFSKFRQKRGCIILKLYSRELIGENIAGIEPTATPMTKTYILRNNFVKSCYQIFLNFIYKNLLFKNDEISPIYYDFSRIF